MKRLLVLVEGAGCVALGAIVAEEHQTFSGSQLEVAPVDFFIPKDQKEPVIDDSKWSEAHTWCKVRVKAAMKKGVESIIIPYTWQNRWQKQYYIDRAKEYGYDVQEIFSRSREYSQPQLTEAIGQAA